ncbi:RUN and FYVE domain-containing protein 1 [Linum perenne]
MLEKIGLPPKPSLRGNAWVVDATHCQGCASQFTFINRKHHCRRCGGMFCGTCTQQRMVLRGQGDSPVRICDPCKKLEEAARFELRHGYKNRTAKAASSKSVPRDEDELLNQILGGDGLVDSKLSRGSSSSSASCSTRNNMDHGGEMSRSYSVDHVEKESFVTTTPEELRLRAVEEKGKYRTLKAGGKPEEAMKAFKRGKELERQAEALEITIRRNRRKSENRKKDVVMDPGGKMPRDKDDLLAELKDIGLSEVDLQEKEKKQANLSLEGELFSLLGDVPQRTGKEGGTGNGGGGIDKSGVIAHKRKALMLKREGKLDEAKQELKKAKILEKELEEKELLGGAENDSDDEIAALIRGMDGGKDDDLLSSYEQPGIDFNFSHLDDGAGFDVNVEVTDDDLVDPEMAATLRSLGWADNDSDAGKEPVFDDREAMQNEILSLKKEALSLKRAGNVAEAMTQLKKAKLLEKSLAGEESSSHPEPVAVVPKSSSLGPKSRMMIQKELLSLKKKALTLRREGKVAEADEELRKGKVLEQQLEDMDTASKVPAPSMGVQNPDTLIDLHADDEGGDEDVTEEDLSNPAYLSLLSNLGWKEENSGLSSNPPVIRTPKKTRGELQRELLGLKRKALTLRREGKSDEADDVLRSAKELEIQMAEMEEVPKKEETRVVESFSRAEPEAESVPPAPAAAATAHSDVVSSSSRNTRRRSKGEIQRELLGIKRKALALRRKGETEEADELLQMAKVLEADLEELEGSRQEQLPPEVFATPEPLIDVNAAGPIDAVVMSSTSLAEQASSGEVRIAAEKGSHSSALPPPRPETMSVNNRVESTDDGGHGQASSSESVQQQVLARKRRAVALKREGKLVEARDELRQAKLLEKTLENESPSTDSPAKSSPPPAKKKESPIPIESPPPSNPAPKLSGRDRFKLQQESLSHKRQALKLRREGRTAEAEAEFELAKSLEAQLDAASPEKQNPDGNDAGIVEDLLDPQLLAALRAIGIDDGSSSSSSNVMASSQARAKPDEESARVSPGDEKRELEERIKAEKVKAVNLKRAGKQADAVDALRRAKLYEKRLNSLS